MCKVVNIRNTQEEYIYIGKVTKSPNLSKHFGNPFSHLNYKNIEQERRLWILDNIKELRGKNLGCFCSPLPCHGDILLKLANS